MERDFWGGGGLGYDEIWMPEWEYQGKQGQGKITRYQYGLRRSDNDNNLEVSANYQWSPDNNPEASVLIEKGDDSLDIRWKGFNNGSIEKKEKVEIVLEVGADHWWVVQTDNKIEVYKGKENELCPHEDNQKNLGTINRLISGKVNFRFYPNFQTTIDSMVGVTSAILTKIKPTTKLPAG